MNEIHSKIEDIRYELAYKLACVSYASWSVIDFLVNIGDIENSVRGELEDFYGNLRIEI